MALAVILSSVRHISDKVFLEAAKVSVGAYLNLAETRGFSSGFLPDGEKKMGLAQRRSRKISAPVANVDFHPEIERPNNKSGCKLPPSLARPVFSSRPASKKMGFTRLNI